MKSIRVFFALLALIALTAVPAWSELSGQQIIRKSKEALQAADAVNKVQMTLINKRGDKLVQRMVTRTKNVNGATRQVTTFLYPDETKGTKFLVLENADRSDDMFIFIPGLKRIRTISTSQRNQSYMGTDFSYGDLEALEADVGQHTVIRTEALDGQDCHVVQSILDPKQGAGYSKIINWYRTDEFLPIKTEYYDKDGALKKVKTIPSLYKDGSSWVLKKMIMKNVQKNHQTIIEIIESNSTKVEDSFFTKQFLLQTDRF